MDKHFMLMKRHALYRFILALPSGFVAYLVLLSMWRGEGLDTWPLLLVACAWALILFLDGMRTLMMIPKYEKTPAWYPRSKDVEAMARRAGPYIGRLGELSYGTNQGPEIVYSLTRRTGQVNQWGEPVCLTIGTDHDGNIVQQEYHFEDRNVGLLDRGGHDEQEDPNPFDR